LEKKKNLRKCSQF